MSKTSSRSALPRNIMYLQIQGRNETVLLFQKCVLATWISDMLVLPLDFKLSLTHLRVTTFISEKWWKAVGWWPHSHLEWPSVSALIRCSYTVTFFLFLMGLLISLWYVGFLSPHLHQHPMFFHKPAKSTSFQGASCFSIIIAGLRLPPAPWPFPSLFFFYTLTTDALTPKYCFSPWFPHPWQPVSSGCESALMLSVYSHPQGPACWASFLVALPDTQLCCGLWSWRSCEWWAGAHTVWACTLEGYSLLFWDFKKCNMERL